MNCVIAACINKATITAIAATRKLYVLIPSRTLILWINVVVMLGLPFSSLDLLAALIAVLNTPLRIPTSNEVMII